MKKTIQHLLTLTLFLFSLGTGQAQESNSVRQPGYWTLGINAGWAYQQSDVPIDWKGWGVGATLAKNLYYKPGAIFGFDARGRFLYDRTYGLDHAQSSGINNNDALNGGRGDGIDYTVENGGPGFVYQNHRTEKGELAIEGVLHFNRLREKTNINLALFGGIGLDIYKTKIDQRDSDGLYSTDYLGLNPRDPVSFKKSFLRDNILDGIYETDAQGFENTAKVNLMPAIGAELGYQFTPRFSMGLSHKLTFAQTDLLDGQKWRNDNLASSNNDLHHYTNLHMRWIIDAGMRRKMQPPIIQMIRPTNNPHKTRETYADIGAKVLHVNSAMDITCTVNGTSVPFNFQREYFSLFHQNLRPGRNEVIITATNNAGRDQERLTIIYEESIIDTPPPNSSATPRVRVTNPPNRSVTTPNEYFDFTAEVDHVSRKQELTLSIDGRNLTDFDFDASRGFVRANIRLQKGRNYVQLKAKTRGGSDEDDAIITYDKRAEQNDRRPEVRITRPSGNPYRTQNERVSLEADVQEVSNKGDITVRLNGRALRDFNFDGRTVRTELYLRDGENTVEVEASNNAGRARDNQTIIFEDRYTPPNPGRAPVVTFTRPSQRNSTSSSQRYDIRASIKNVNSKNDIRFYVNGRRVSNFNFNNETLSQNITLQNGNNTISIEASNSVGNDQAEVYINYSKITTPSNPPQVNITRPTSSNSSSATINLEAKVLNVTTKSGITLTLNGRSVSKFSFNTSSKLVTANLILNNGRNTIIVKARNADGNDEDSKVINYQKAGSPPQVNITRPVAATSTTPNVSLEAKVLNVTSKRDITISLNGRTITAFAFNTKSKIVSSSLVLKGGKNTIVVKANNTDGSDQDSKSITYTVASSNPPQVSITRPTARTVSSPSQSVQAKILNVTNKSNISLLLNGARISNFSFNSSTKIMSATVTLRSGTNTIVVKANNTDGSDQDSKSITYTKASNPPQVDITRPTAKSTAISTITLQAKVLNITDKNKISVSLNGTSIKTFNFNTLNKTLTTQMKLRPGNNTIIVKATNSDGSDQDSHIISYTVASKPPTVVITSPRSKAQLKNATSTVKATIKEVSSRTGVKFYVNGKANSSFTFSGTTFSGTAKLVKGQNTIKVTATNGDGTDNASVTVFYDPPVLLAKPVVKFVNPARPNTNVRGKNFTVKVNVQNVTAKSQITFKVNNKVSSRFAFNSSTGLLTSTLVLQSGSTKFEVIATNTSGRASANTSVNFGGIIISPENKTPKLTFVSISEPTVDPFQPDTGRSTFVAKVSNLTSKNQVTFFVNGEASTNFTYNTKTKTIKAIGVVKRGNNTLTIKVKNASGEDQLSKTIVF